MRKKILSIQKSQANELFIKWNVSRIFSGYMEGDQLQDIVDRAELVDVAEGTDIIEKGAAGDYCYIVAEGQVGIFVPSADGKTEVNIARVKSGTNTSIVGERALLFDEPRNATVRTSCDTRLIRLNKDDFLHLTSASEHIPLRKWLHELATKRTEEIFNKVVMTPERRQKIEKLLKTVPERQRYILHSLIDNERSQMYMAYTSHRTTIFSQYEQRFDQFMRNVEFLTEKVSPRDTSRNPVDDVLFMYEHLPINLSNSGVKANREELAMDMVCSRNWSGKFYMDCLGTYADACQKLGINREDMGIVLADRNDRAGVAFDNHIILPVEKDISEIKEHLLPWILVEISQALAAKEIKRIINGTKDINKIKDLFNQEHQTANLHIPRFNLDDVEDRERVINALSFMLLVKISFALSGIIDHEIMNYRRETQKQVAAYFSRHLNMSGGNIDHHVDGVNPDLRYQMISTDLDCFQHIFYSIISKAEKAIQVPEESLIGMPEMFSDDEIEPDMLEFYKGIEFIMEDPTIMRVKHGAVLTMLQANGINILTGSDYADPKILAEVPYSTKQILSNANLHFAIGGLAEVLAGLKEDESNELAHRIVHAVNFAKEQVKLRWNPVEIIRDGLEHALDWAEIQKKPNFHDVKGKTFLLDNEVRNMFIQYAATCRQTTRSGRLDVQHKLIIDFFRTIDDAYINRAVNLFRVVDIGIAADNLDEASIAITPRELTQKMKIYFPERTQVIGIDRKGIGGKSALNRLMKEGRQHVLPYDDSSLTYIEADAAEYIPLPDDSANAVLICNVIMHLNDEAQEKILLNALKVLRPGGLLIAGFDEGGYQVYTKNQKDQIYCLGSMSNVQTELSLTPNEFIENLTQIRNTDNLPPVDLQEILRPFKI